MAVLAGDNILTAVSVAKECGIVSPAEIMVTVTAVPAVKDTPARVFYTSPRQVGSCESTLALSGSVNWLSTVQADTENTS
jgi:magnesium-transporting ATPase (P-type)